MWSFAAAFTELAFELASELRATGRADLARELEACMVRTISYDAETDVGLLALQPQRDLTTLERSAIGQKLGQVIAFEGTRYASLQLDNFGRVVAVDLRAPPKDLRWRIMQLTSNPRGRGP